MREKEAAKPKALLFFNKKNRLTSEPANDSPGEGRPRELRN